MNQLQDLTNWITAAGALGMAAFGLVEALKAKSFIGLAGLRELRAAFERPAGGVLLRLLRTIYGAEEFEALLEATYRRGPADTREFLRNGLRLALSSQLDAKDREAAATALGQDPAQLQRAYEVVRVSSESEVAAEPSLAERKVIGQAELVIDARVEAAVCYADTVLAGRKRWLAGLFAVCASLLLTALEGELAPAGQAMWKGLGNALFVGLAAVPIAPITRDLVSLLQSARDALRGRTQ